MLNYHCVFDAVCYVGDVVFAAHIAEALERVSEVKEQLQSFSKHQQVRTLHFLAMFGDREIPNIA